MSGRHSRNKGATFERHVAALFREMGAEGARRGRQDAKEWFAGVHEADITGVPGLWIEAKRSARLSLGSWLAQAVQDADGTGLKPLVVFKQDRRPIMVATTRPVLDSWVGTKQFSLTVKPHKRIVWDDVWRTSADEALQYPWNPPVVVLRWTLFKEIWLCRRGS